MKFVNNGDFIQKLTNLSEQKYILKPWYDQDTSKTTEISKLKYLYY